jgi:hypothetical protein
LWEVGGDSAKRGRHHGRRELLDCSEGGDAEHDGELPPSWPVERVRRVGGCDVDDSGDWRAADIVGRGGRVGLFGSGGGVIGRYRGDRVV